MKLLKGLALTTLISVSTIFAAAHDGKPDEEWENVEKPQSVEDQQSASVESLIAGLDSGQNY